MTAAMMAAVIAVAIVIPRSGWVRVEHGTKHYRHRVPRAVRPCEKRQICTIKKSLTNDGESFALIGVFGPQKFSE